MVPENNKQPEINLERASMHLSNLIAQRMGMDSGDFFVSHTRDGDVYHYNIVIGEANKTRFKEQFPELEVIEDVDNKRLIHFDFHQENAQKLFPKVTEAAENDNETAIGRFFANAVNAVAGLVGINTRRGQGSEINFYTADPAPKEKTPNLFQKAWSWVKDVPNKINSAFNKLLDNMGFVSKPEDDMLESIMDKNVSKSPVEFIQRTEGMSSTKPRHTDMTQAVADKLDQEKDDPRQKQEVRPSGP